mgnify:CR=1 FL=1
MKTTNYWLAAVALASLGQSMAMAFTVMLAFGLGCSAVLLAAGSAAAQEVLEDDLMPAVDTSAAEPRAEPAVDDAVGLLLPHKRQEFPGLLHRDGRWRVKP